jgi:hypothetical protein
MKRSTFSEKQVIAIQREQEVGVAMAEVCRKHGGFKRSSQRRNGGWCDGGSAALGWGLAG